GNLGFEALSRGSRHVVFVENSRKSLEILRKNVALLGVGDSVDVMQSDVMKYLKRASDTFDLIFIDPPFTEKMAHEVLGAVAASRVFGLNTKIVIEASRHERVES